MEAKQRHQKLRRLFDEASNLTAIAQSEFVMQVCAEDAQLGAELMELLRSDLEQALRATQKPAALITQSFESLDDAYWLGRTVGRYQIESRLGMGGMGQVFLCKRLEGDVAQRVALKIIRRDAMTANLAKRFEDERQILATLQHPGIAHFIDAGIDDSGLPFFAMEYVDGLPFSHYCEQNNLSIVQRIALFRKIVAAIAYAHRNLVIHRDLKPSNVLITAEGEVKLLDFGIAKVLASTHHTATSDRTFTMAYAAPEQLTGRNMGIACDIYGLGALLYEALCGAPPFDVTQTSVGAIEKQIMDTPPKPMTQRFAAFAKNQGAAYKNRSPEKWRRALAGDLEHIVQKALRKEAEARYRSADEFDADLLAFLEGRAVRATGGGSWYRLQKFVARHRWACATAGVFAASLSAAFVVIILQNIAVAKQRDRAESALQMLQDAFVSADPARVTKGASTARQILERSTEQISKLIDTQPENYVLLGNKLAEVNLALGLNNEAWALADKVKVVARGIDNVESISKARATATRALIGASRYAEAEILISEAEAAGDGEDVQVLLAKGQMYARTNRIKPGIELLLMGISKLNPDPANAEWATANWQLADAYRKDGDLVTAIRVLDENVEILEKALGKSHVLTLRGRLFRADQLRRMNRIENALQLGPQLIADVESNYGVHSSFSAVAHVSYANALSEDKQHKKSIEHYEQAINAYEQSIGAASENTIRTRFNLAQMLAYVEPNSDRADPHFRRAIADAEQASPSDLRLVTFFRYHFANYYFSKRMFALALSTYSKALTRGHMDVQNLEDRDYYAEQARRFFVASECTAMLSPTALSTLTKSLADMVAGNQAICREPVNSALGLPDICSEFRSRYCESFVQK